LLICDKLQLKTTITTNAQLIKKSTVKIIEESEYIVPVISLQTLNPKLNFKLMGARPERQIRLIEYFNEVGKKCRVNTVYTQQTIKQIEELTDFCIQNKVERFSIANYSEVTGYTKIKKKFNLLDLRKLNEHITTYISSKNSDLIFATEGCHLFTAYPELINDSIEFTKFNSLYFGCRSKHTKMEIMSNGDVLPCIAFLGDEHKKRNAFLEKLLDIWFNDKLYNEIRNFRTQNKKCISCSLVEICEGGCYANLMRKENPQNSKDSVCLL